MAFGTEMMVLAHEVAADRAGTVHLAEFTPGQADGLFPFAPDDPALKFFPDKTVELLEASNAQPYLDATADTQGVLRWGIWTPASKRTAIGQSTEDLCGVVSLTYDQEHEPTEAEVTIFLRQQARNKGIGTLAVAGVLDAAGSPRFWERSEIPFPRTIKALTACIHAQNTPSIKLFSKLGFTDESPQPGWAWGWYVASLHPDAAASRPHHHKLSVVPAG